VDAITAFRFISFLSDRNKDDAAASFLDAGASKAGGKRREDRAMEGWSKGGREGGARARWAIYIRRAQLPSKRFFQTQETGERDSTGAIMVD